MGCDLEQIAGPHPDPGSGKYKHEYNYQNSATMANPHYVYILTNQRHTVFYVGETADLPQRLFRHNSGFYPNAFTKKYNVNILGIL